MKINNIVIRPSRISIHNKDTFHAQYKGKTIQITTDHNLGKSKDKNLTRYMVDVWDNKSGMKDVDALQDLENINEAILYALEGACLIK